VIKSTIPTSPILKKYIDCFYIYEGTPNSAFNYIAFPHFNTGISIFTGVSVQRKQRSLEFSEKPEKGVHVEILGKYTSPLLIKYKGKVREISIIFKPLGLNRFINDDYQSLAPEFSQELNNDKWCQFGKTFFLEDINLSKLESFLLSQFSEKQSLLKIENSLQFLVNNIEQIPISTIATKAGLNLKTYQRYFKKHMGCSPIEYRRICRFRNSLTNKLNSSELKNLTTITYEEGFFDQSYFIREFRKLTNHNPKDFFKSTSKVDGDQIIWEIK
jgi:AraC-like DNA-binding protein